MSSPELQQLLHILDERDSGLSPDDVAWAFESPKTKDHITAWVKEYLSPVTLLTREELTFFQSKGDRSKSRGATGNVVSDEGLEMAVEALETSAASIEKQCRLLEAQKRAIEDIMRRNSSTEHSEAKTQKSSSMAREKAQLDLDSAQLSETLKGQLQASVKQSESAISGMTSSVEGIFEKDDRVLDGLEKIVSQISGTESGLESIDDVERLCQALIMQSTEDIHTQIDSAYRTAVQQHGKGLNGHHDDNESQEVLKQRETLRAELSELCREVDSLSSMAVDSQYRNPITRALQIAKEDIDAEKAAWSEYVGAVLQYLILRLDAANDNFEHLQGHSNALKTVSTALEGVVDTTSNRELHTNSSSKSPSKQSQRGLKPLRLVQENLSENQDSAVQLLRQLDVRIPDSNDATKLPESLASSRKEQSERLVSLATSSERSIADQLAQSLVKAEMDVQALLGAVYSPSSFGTVRLVRKEVKESMDRLEERTQSIGDDMRALDVNDIAGDLQTKQRDLLQKLQR